MYKAVHLKSEPESTPFNLPFAGWTPITGPEIRENRLFWLSMIHMIVTKYEGILELFARLSTAFTLFARLFSHADMGCAKNKSSVISFIHNFLIPYGWTMHFSGKVSCHP